MGYFSWAWFLWGEKIPSYSLYVAYTVKTSCVLAGYTVFNSFSNFQRGHSAIKIISENINEW